MLLPTLPKFLTLLLPDYPNYFPGCQISPNGGLRPSTLRPLIAPLCPVLGFPHQRSFSFPDIYLAASLSHSQLHTPFGGPGAPVRGEGAGGERGTRVLTESAISYTRGAPSWARRAFPGPRRCGAETGLPPPPGRELTFSEAGAGVYNYCPPPRQGRRPADRPRWRWRRG